MVSLVLLNTWWLKPRTLLEKFSRREGKVESNVSNLVGVCFCHLEVMYARNCYGRLTIEQVNGCDHRRVFEARSHKHRRAHEVRKQTSILNGKKKKAGYQWSLQEVYTFCRPRTCARHSCLLQPSRVKLYSHVHDHDVCLVNDESVRLIASSADQ